MYSTANERSLDLKRLFVCLAANCRRDGYDPYFLLQKIVCRNAGGGKYKLKRSQF
ncbi:MAG: hypothetical protein LBP59_17790 [Planctomycetaceae bacterium]|nr:hypothetical protein [Planctomycetaceae bacterium]